jgi:hypothetical protein
MSIFYKTLLKLVIDAGLAEITISDKTTDSLQKYRRYDERSKINRNSNVLCLTNSQNYILND